MTAKVGVINDLSKPRGYALKIDFRNSADYELAEHILFQGDKDVLSYKDYRVLVTIGQAKETPSADKKLTVC